MAKFVLDEWEELSERFLGRRNPPKKMKRGLIEKESSAPSPPSLSEYIKTDDLLNLPADIFKVGNKLLQIPREKMINHPCAIIETTDPLNIAVSKGTDAARLADRYLHHYVIIERDGVNGLSKKTAFETSIRRIIFRFIFKSDRLGRLTDHDFCRLKNSIKLRQ